MRILQIGKYYPPVRGGIEAHVQVLSSSLVKKKEISHLTVVASNITPRLANTQIGKLRIILLPRVMFLSVPFNFSLGRYLKQPCDIIHIHLPNPTAVLAYFFAKPSTPVVVTWHADFDGFIIRKLLLRPFLHYLFRKSKVIFVTNPVMLSSLRQFESKIKVVPLGIALPLKPDTKTLLYEKLRGRENFVLFIGRLVRYKGIEYLIRSMRHVNSVLFIIGDGPLRR